ncbi:MAG: OmpP1/FadL family transporter [Acidobacteriota bacterium]
MRSILAAMGVLAVVLLYPSPGFAQRPLQIPVQFDFINPGARSLALGGAFTGLADDATAAFTNPAGLKILTRREMSIEARLGRTLTTFLDGGRLQGAVTNQGIDRLAGPTFGESADSALGLSFASLVVPVGKGTLAAYRHELARFDSSVQTSGPFSAFGREQFLQQDKRLRIINYGVSGAYRVSDKVSIGAGVVVSDFSLSGTTRLFAPDPTRFFDAPSYPADRQTFVATQRGSDVGFGLTVGVVVTPNRRVQIGGVVRRSPQGTFTQFEQALPNGEVFFDNVPGKFKVPNHASLGVSIRPQDELLLSVEYSRVQYSSLERDFIRLQAGPENRPGRPNFFERLYVPDSNEVHFGAEYVLVNLRWQPALRGGIWYDPDHSVQYRAVNDNTADDVLFATAFGVGEDQVHYSGGFGLAVNPRFEVNLGVDISTRVRTASLSGIFRF